MVNSLSHGPESSMLEEPAAEEFSRSVFGSSI